MMSVHLRIDVDDALEPDAREPKLPKWAQDLLAQQRRVLQRLHAYAVEAQLATEPNDSDAVLRPYGEPQLGLGPIGLGRHVSVRFLLAPTPGHPEPYVDLRLEDNRQALRVMTGERLWLHPLASNVAQVLDRREP